VGDGGVHARGNDVPLFGSTGGNRPGVHNFSGLALSIGWNGKVNGYWLVASDGGVHAFGAAPFWGSTGGNNGGSLVTNIVSYPAPRPDDLQQTRGYAWVHANGTVGVAEPAQ
jgi:hypothetical protein